MDDKELRSKLESILDEPMTEENMVAMASGLNAYVLNKMVPVILADREQYAAVIKREYALKGANAVLQDLSDWMMAHDDMTLLATHRHITAMIGHVELKKIDPDFTQPLTHQERRRK